MLSRDDLWTLRNWKTLRCEIHFGTDAQVVSSEASQAIISELAEAYGCGNSYVCETKAKQDLLEQLRDEHLVECTGQDAFASMWCLTALAWHMMRIVQVLGSATRFFGILWNMGLEDASVPLSNDVAQSWMVVPHTLSKTDESAGTETWTQTIFDAT